MATTTRRVPVLSPFSRVAVAAAGAYVGAQVIADVTSLKIGSVAGRAVDMGTFIYLITFTLRDVVHKALGKRAARTLVLTAAVVNVAMALYLQWAARPCRGSGGSCSASMGRAVSNCPASSTGSARPAARVSATHPEVLQVLDPRPLLDEAAEIAARYSAGGLLMAETLAAGLVHGHQLWFGTPRNVGRAPARIAEDLRIDPHVAEPT